MEIPSMLPPAKKRPNLPLALRGLSSSSSMLLLLLLLLC